MPRKLTPEALELRKELQDACSELFRTIKQGADVPGGPEMYLFAAGHILLLSQQIKERRPGPQTVRHPKYDTAP